MPIEVATPNDVTALAALINSAYRGEGSRAGWTTEADYFEGQSIDPANLEADLFRAPGRYMLMLREAGTLLGCVYLRSGEGSCYLGMLSINPASQAKGLGRQLMAAAEDKARALGATRMVLRVLHPRTELMEWYERRGYIKTGETAPFPYEAQREIERPTRDDLHFLIFEKSLV